ncbi:MAG: ferritin family protein [Thermodesulfobacteriota bacterium]|nr:ferritin family protein [Thermodesulfobacteriota bacterium]
MNFNSIEEIISYAIEKEKEAVQFYEDISKQETFSGARKTFEGFAKEERKHQAMLEDFSVNQDKISEYKLEWITDIKRSDYLVDIEYKKGMHYTDILRLAMKREEKALKLYNDLMHKADNENVIKLFKMLAQEEAKHKGFLEGLYDDYMAEQGD